MIRDGWGSPNPVFRHFFTSTFIPDAPPEVAASFDELQRIATSPAAALRLWDDERQVDVTELARQMRVPTLVLHCEGDRVAPMEEGRRHGQAHPGREFVELPGNNHVLLEGTPAFDRFFEETAAFWRSITRSCRPAILRFVPLRHFGNGLPKFSTALNSSRRGLHSHCGS